MDALTIFILEIALCLGISVALILTLKPLLRDLLTETCGSEKRAGFWVTFTQLMLVISPLLIVVYFAPTETNIQINVASELQHALFRTLLGDFIALSAIGQIIWKSISSPYNQAIPGTEQEAT